MKILAVNSSWHKEDQSMTSLYLRNLLKGMISAGGDVQTIYLRKKKINFCKGCFLCWESTPNRCIQKDDMTAEILPQFLASDIVVYASPLYNHTMNSLMSQFKERLLPVSLPSVKMEKYKNHYQQTNIKLPDVVWLSVCALADHSEFDLLSDYVRKTCPPEVKLIAEIYRSAAFALTGSRMLTKKKEILRALRQAGREIIANRQISPETMAIITQAING